MFTRLDYSSALEYSIIRRYTNIVYYYYYVCCCDCVGVCVNVCCVAAVVKDSVFLAWKC